MKLRFMVDVQNFLGKDRPIGSMIDYEPVADSEEDTEQERRQNGVFMFEDENGHFVVLREGIDAYAINDKGEMEYRTPFCLGCPLEFKLLGCYPRAKICRRRLV